MRKTIITLLLILATASCAVAQRQYSPNLAIGAKAGATISRMSFSPSTDQKMLTGFIAGITARYMEEKHFGLIAELNIEQRGWQEDFSEPPAPFNYKRTLTYIQLPLLTHIYFGSDRARGFFNLGPEVGYMISNSIKSNFDYNDPASVEGFPLHNRVTNQMSMEIKNKFDYGIAAGVGAELIMARRHSLILEGRFYYGLGNIFPSAKKDYFSASRGMSIQVSASYMFRLF